MQYVVKPVNESAVYLDTAERARHYVMWKNGKRHDKLRPEDETIPVILHEGEHTCAVCGDARLVEFVMAALSAFGAPRKVVDPDPEAHLRVMKQGAKLILDSMGVKHTL